MVDETSINDQISDSVEQIKKLLSDDNGDNVRAFSYQMMAHSIGLAMYNAVHQQQQRYIIQNAITTAATKAILEASPEQALKMAEEGLGEQHFTQTMHELKAMMDDLNSTYKELNSQLTDDLKHQVKPEKTAVKKGSSTSK